MTSISVQRAGRIAAALAGVAAVSWGAAWAAARALVVRVPLTHADALLVLSGSPVYRERVAHAGRLYLEGRAARVLLTNDGVRGSWSRTLQRNPLSVERAVLQLTRAGVSPTSIEVLPGHVSSTYDEAVAVRDYAASHGIASVLAVTSGFHSRRALWALRQALEVTGVSVGIEPAPVQSPSPATWWRSAQGWSMVAGEYVKFVYYAVRYS